MTFYRLAFASLVTLALAGPAVADESGSFIVRLGQDTTSVEHYSRSESRLEVNQVGRAPRVLQRHFSYEYTAGVMTKMTFVVTPPGTDTPTQSIAATVGPDSLRMVIHNGSAPVQNLSVALPAGTLVVPTSSPWALYEGLFMKLVRGRSDSLRTTMYFIGADGANWLSLHKLGRDSVAVLNEHQDNFHARVDKAGHLLGVLPISGTGKFSVERVGAVDLAGLAASFGAREKAGAGLGTLSPRDTVRVTGAGGAMLWIDYGRPGKRGRTVYGGIVPYGEVWRTGANAATRFRTDKALDFGGTVVPAGFYTLWTIPSADGWKLVVNSETGQWGTLHKAEKDLFTIPMKTSTLAQPVERFTIGVEPGAQGGTLNMDWDTTRASATFTTKP